MVSVRYLNMGDFKKNWSSCSCFLYLKKNCKEFPKSIDILVIEVYQLISKNQKQNFAFDFYWIIDKIQFSIQFSSLLRAMKGYSTFPEDPGLDPQHQILFSVINRTLVACLYENKRKIIYIR